MKSMPIQYLLLCLAIMVKRSSCAFVNLINKNLTVIPDNLENDTEYLILSANRITEINNLERYPKLMYLALDHNEIKSQDDIRGISAAKNLKFLDLSSNGLLTLNLNNFWLNSNLTGLTFGNNPDINLDSSILNLPRLENLTLNNCSLSKIPWLNFSGVPSLKNLSLHDNNIKDIPKEAIESMPNSLEIMVDEELYSILSKRDDVKDKKIKLISSIPTTSSTEPPKRSSNSSTNLNEVDAKPPINQDNHNKESTNIVVYLVIAVIAVVISVVVICVLRVKKWYSISENGEMGQQETAPLREGVPIEMEENHQNLEHSSHCQPKETIVNLN